MLNKLLTIIKYTVVVSFLLTLTSCYTQTIEDFSTFTVQVPVYFYDKSYVRRTPSQGFDFTNLNTNTEFVNNKDRINRAQVFQFSCWIDSLVFPVTNKPFNPNEDELIISRIRYLIQFAKPKDPSLEFSNNPNDFVIDYSIAPFVVGDFQDVKVSEYYKNPYHIVTVDEDRAVEMSDRIKTMPYFFLISEYSRYENQPADTIYFPYSEIRADLVIRLTVNI
ncbi:MAG: hypothetical protein A2X64_10075 [Ignavibacteria bacterium GWF2_33_9]|nr:MAG: hypothetical protein A2X64_10075 [Ignavibacteria bacterium GWF2_33_9]